MADLNKIGNSSTPVYPTRPGKPVREREAPPRRSPQERKEESDQENDDGQDGSQIDEFA